VWDPRDPERELARFDGHTHAVMAAAVLDWPGLDHQVIVTTSSDQTARVWDPRQPRRELARINNRTGAGFWGVAALDWPGLDHQVIVTTSIDRAARVWDPTQPDRELAYLPLFGESLSTVALNPRTLAFASTRGFLVFELKKQIFLAKH
jgi:WD40 repeat protein